jgi:hypothetical protein
VAILPPGYSEKSLAQKLGIVPGASVCTLHAPSDYLTWLEPLDPTVTFQKRVTATTTLTHGFYLSKADLAQDLERLRTTIAPDATVWISWPKKASKVSTDVTEHVIRELALPLGFVDVKVCAVSPIWSGLKLVVRKHLR